SDHSAGELGPVIKPTTVEGCKHAFKTPLANGVIGGCSDIPKCECHRVFLSNRHIRRDHLTGTDDVAPVLPVQAQALIPLEALESSSVHWLGVGELTTLSRPHGPSAWARLVRTVFVDPLGRLRGVFRAIG